MSNFFATPFFIFIILIIILIPLIMLYTPFRAAVVFNENGIQLRIFNFILLGSKKKKKKTADDKSRSDKNKPKMTLNSLTKKISQLKEVYETEKDELDKFFNHLKRLTKLIYYRIIASFGLDDPSDTGIATGVVYSVFSGIEAYLKNYITPKKNSYFTVTPNFINQVFEIKGEIVFSISLIKLIRMIRLVKNIYRRNKRKVKIIIGGGRTYE